MIQRLRLTQQKEQDVFKNLESLIKSQSRDIRRVRRDISHDDRSNQNAYNLNKNEYLPYLGKQKRHGTLSQQKI